MHDNTSLTCIPIYVATKTQKKSFKIYESPNGGNKLCYKLCLYI